MDTTSLEESMAGFSDKFRKFSLVIVIVTMIITGALLANLVYNPPTFNTDLDAFTPDSEEYSAHERIHQNFPNESRPMFVNIEVDDESNILTIENIQLMLQHYDQLKLLSEKTSDSVVVWTTTPSILQTALDEEGNQTNLSTITDWNQLIDLIIDEDVECRLTSDDQFLSAATYASSALLHKDLDINPTCDYLSTGEGDGTPFASSTLWVLEIDPELTEEERKSVQIQFRNLLGELSEDSSLDYGVVSLDLLSSDIDDRTLDNVTLLVFLALIVVVILLVFTFRSFRDVTFPLVGLTSALIWTYGLLNVIGVEFSALEVAVAPLVLGLGIDYAIHLQRANSTLREQYPDPAESWLRACAKLSVPLSLAVITTVAAFLANMISPLPPLKTFGFALAMGVVCAFITSTLVVGALHVLIDSEKYSRKSKPFTLPSLTNNLVKVQQKQQVGIFLVVVFLSGASVLGAASLETNFDLGDFVDSEMEIMDVRQDLSDNYDSAGWKLIYVLFEPSDNQNEIIADEDLLTELRGLHGDLESNHDVVGTDGTFPSPSYEGPYVVLRDAILRDSSFGDEHNLEVFQDGGVYVKDYNQECDLSVAFLSLSNNDSIADALSGETWSERVRNSVYLEDGKVMNLRNEIRVEAKTSTESEQVVLEFENMLGDVDKSGTLRYNLADNAKLYVTGDLAMLQTVLDGLSSSQVESTLISLSVSFLVLFLLTRRIMPAIVILFPVGIASLWVVGSMAAIGLKWNVLTVMVTALTLGIGIDYSIHMWRRFEVELQRRNNHWDALRASLSTTGVALLMSALTTSLGFMVLLFSPMPIIQDFGLITAITVIFSLLLSLVLLPVLMELSARSKEEDVIEKEFEPQLDDLA
ncbi:MAG TPA: MMPL family transporter [Candidatus Poseidoniaceae archaeon]|nr:MMPL family transporter [Candidatus Poseidoniaceae archaeon]